MIVVTTPVGAASVPRFAIFSPWQSYAAWATRPMQ